MTWENHNNTVSEQMIMLGGSKLLPPRLYLLIRHVTKFMLPDHAAIGE